MSEKDMTREEVYDAKIWPLMGKIIRICKRRGIPFVAGFELDPLHGVESNPRMVCVTAVGGVFVCENRAMRMAAEILEGEVRAQPTAPSMVLKTIRSDGSVASVEVIAP